MHPLHACVAEWQQPIKATASVATSYVHPPPLGVVAPYTTPDCPGVDSSFLADAVSNTSKQDLIRRTWPLAVAMFPRPPAMQAVWHWCIGVYFSIASNTSKLSITSPASQTPSTSPVRQTVPVHRRYASVYLRIKHSEAAASRPFDAAAELYHDMLSVRICHCFHTR